MIGTLNSGGAGAAGAAGLGALAGDGGASGGAGTVDIAGTAGCAATGGAGAVGGAGQAGGAADAGSQDAAAAGGAGGAAGSVGVAGSGGGGAAGSGGQGGTSGAAGSAAGSAGAGGAAGATTSGAAGAVAVDYCDRARWTAKASVTTGDGGGPPAGIDGDLTTRWANNHGQTGMDWYAVDFGGTVKLSKITLNNTLTYPDDYPGAYAVYGSSDGVTFDATPFVTGSGANPSTVITFAQRSVRAVRVNQTGTSRASNWWQIGEFQVICAL
jgi:hypothetical protein